MLGFFLEAEHLGRLVAELEPLQVTAGVALGASAALLLGRKAKSVDFAPPKLVPDFWWDIVLFDGRGTDMPMDRKDGMHLINIFARQRFALLADVVTALHADSKFTKTSARVVGALDSLDDPLTLLIRIDADQLAFTLTIDRIEHGSIWARLFLQSDGDVSGAKAAYWGIALGVLGVAVGQINEWRAPDTQHSYVCYLNATSASLATADRLSQIGAALRIEGPHDAASIEKVQHCLNELGFDVGEVDGEIGPKFRRGTRDLADALNIATYLDAKDLWADQPFVSLFVQYTQEQYQKRLAAAMEADDRFVGLKPPFT